MTLFLATTDATIVSTILPTISSQFSASHLEYTWVGVAYMLTQTALQPLYGKLSDLAGRKLVLYASMAIFVAGSMCCGSAQSMLWLILARALAGIGGGGIVSLVWTITSEIVDIESRAKWSQALSITWSCSAIAGPLLGGVFSENGVFSWRWAFYLNLPVCLLAFVVIFISLRGVDVGCAQPMSWKKFGSTFDFLGLLLFMSGSSCIVVGFSFASTLGWSNPLTLVLIIGGILVLILGGFYEIRTRRAALFPRPAFTDLTTIVILMINFLHNFTFNAGTYYLALYFQTVGGLTPLRAGIAMLPYSLGSSVASMPVAWFVSYWQRQKSDLSGQKYAISIGLAVSALGFGLMKTLDGHTSPVLQTIFPLLTGVGLGMLFHAPYQVFLSALQPSDMASGTSAFFLVRFTGATIGLSVAGAAFNVRLSSLLPAEVGPVVFNLESLQSMLSADLRLQTIQAVASSIQTIWLICAPCLTLAFMVGIYINVFSKPSLTSHCLQISLLIRTRVCPVRRSTETQERQPRLPAPQNAIIGEKMSRNV
ncbi:amino acid permease ScVBA-like protein [Cytidiella melzeri]|nr:amino acid permease ScVBA-like protein [Cytidiella melzeri]